MGVLSVNGLCAATQLALLMTFLEAPHLEVWVGWILGVKDHHNSRGPGDGVSLTTVS